MVAIEKPPGVRCTQTGGNWEWCRSTTGTNYLLDELRSLEQALGPHLLALAKAELAQLMREGAAGQLTIGSGRDFDVVQMDAAPDVLELKMEDRGGLHIRLFFSEPAMAPGLMIALMLYWKRPGPIDLVDQTYNAKAASRRLHEWWMREFGNSPDR